VDPVPPARDSLWSDLRWALWVMRRQIAIPILAAAFALFTLALDGDDAFLIGVVAVIYSVTMLGWLGASVVWFRRAALGEWLTLWEVARLIPRFVGPFLRFGLILAIPYGLLLLAIDALVVGGFPRWLALGLSWPPASGSSCRRCSP